MYQRETTGTVAVLLESNHAVVAQLVEHLHGKEGVTGSIPVNGSSFLFAPKKDKMKISGVNYSSKIIIIN